MKYGVAAFVFVSCLAVVAADPPVTIQAEGRGAPWLNLRDGVDLSVQYPQGQASPVGMRPTALVADDLDEDGMPDLVTGYTLGKTGLLVIQRGNPAAILPHLSNGSTAPFFEKASVFSTPAAPDFLVAGDFDNDGHQDIVTASKHGTRLFLHAGDGKGNLRPAQSLELESEVTLLVAGDVNRIDRLLELIVAVDSPDGAWLRVFESPKGAWHAEPEVFKLPASATAATLGDHDRDLLGDIAVAAGETLVLIRGRDRKLAEGARRMAAVPDATVEQAKLGFDASSIAFGDVTGRGIGELVVLSADGTLELIEGATADSIFSIETGVSGGKLVSARATTTPGEDLIVVDQSASRLHVLAGGASLPGSDPHTPAFVRPEMRTTLAVDAEPIDVLPMRLNPDALADLVVLKASAGPTVAVTPSAPASVFTVTNTNDSGAGSLRRAINDANFYAGLDAIHFSIPGTGAHSIHALSGLPQITDPVIVDGTTQPGYAGAPLIQVHGTAGGGTTGLDLATGSSVVRGLAINRFGGDGIRLFGSGGHIIESNYIGTNLAGDAALPNEDGIWGRSKDNVIGGRLAGLGNLISGNEYFGVAFDDMIAPYSPTDVPKSIPDTGVATSTITIVDPTIIEDLDVWVFITHSNVSDLDITLIAPDGTRIGLSLGNGDNGDDYHGTWFDDEAGIAVTAGVAPFYGPHRPEGTLSVLDGEPMSGTWSLEVRDRVLFDAGTLEDWYLSCRYSRSVNNRVEGNRIGVDIDGNLALPNQSGVVWSGEGNFVGAPAAGAGNLISGNSYHEVILSGPGNVAQRNLIGTDASGTLPLGFALDAVLVAGDASLIGGTAVGAGNVVGVNQTCGIRLEEVSGVAIQGNHVGTDPTGTVGLGGYGEGIRIEGGRVNSIGGATPEARNLISDLDVGIEFTESHYWHPFPVFPYGNAVTGNYIGTDVHGGGLLGNRLHGVLINAGYENSVEDGNVICANQESGVWIGPGARENRVVGNDIGVDVTGATDPGNGHGVVVEGRFNVIEDNVISGNEGHGILMTTGDTPTVDTIVASGLPTSIPDQNNLAVRMEFAGLARIVDVVVQIDVDHTRDSDLVIELEAPDGSVVRLTSNNGGDGEGYDGTIFDDGAARSITEGSAPFLGSYRPEVLLATFDGIEAQGIWWLWIRDEVAGETGVLRDFSIILTTVTTQGNRILVNEIGLDLVDSNYVAVPNRVAGIHLEGAGNLIEWNYIAGNFGPGLELVGQAAVGNIVGGNTIGFPDALNPGAGIGNGSDGVVVGPGSSGAPVGNRIGLENHGNLIWYNLGSGVRIAGGTSTSIRENDITQNDGLGIDVGAAGVTLNDPLDADTGPNGLQNFPTITAITVGATETVVEGVLESTPEQTYAVELYSSDTDTSGYGEGTWVATQMVTTSPTGETPFVFVVPGTVPYVTATATGPDGSTSEFSGTMTNLGATGASADMTARRGIGTAVEVTFDPACGAINHAIYHGVSPIIGALLFSDVECIADWHGQAVFDPGDPGPGEFFYFVVVGQNYAHEGSYGQDSFGVERPEAAGFGACDRPQVIATTCP